MPGRSRSDVARQLDAARLRHAALTDEIERLLDELGREYGDEPWRCRGPMRERLLALVERTYETEREAGLLAADLAHMETSA